MVFSPLLEGEAGIRESRDTLILKYRTFILKVTAY